ncbi:translation initiation factor eIF 4e-like domain-containing protein [Dipodascopsis uninucleata]
MDASKIWNRKLNIGSSSISVGGNSSTSSGTIGSNIVGNLQGNRLDSFALSTPLVDLDLRRNGLDENSFNLSRTFSDQQHMLNNILSNISSDSHSDSLVFTSMDGPHTLHYSWTLWFLHRSPGYKISNYEKATKEISSFSTVEDFWKLYSYLTRPSSLTSTSEYHLFKIGVRPIWEDPTNINGGKWIVKLKKGEGSKAWETLLLAILGGEFGEVLSEEIVGAVISVRREADILSVWNKHGKDEEMNQKLKEAIERLLLLSEGTIEYKIHAESIKEGAEKLAAAAAAKTVTSANSTPSSSGEKSHRLRPGGRHSFIKKFSQSVSNESASGKFLGNLDQQRFPISATGADGSTVFGAKRGGALVSGDYGGDPFVRGSEDRPRNAIGTTSNNSNPAVSAATTSSSKEHWRSVSNTNEFTQTR